MPLRELNRQIGSPLQLSRLDKQLSQTQETLTRIQAQVNPARLAQLKTEAPIHSKALPLIHQLSLGLHPFAIDGSGFREQLR